jgi:hypothetical protein
MAAYREEPCARCVKLEEKLSAALGVGLHPYQGDNRVEHKCIFCGTNLYWLDPRDNRVCLLNHNFIPSDNDDMKICHGSWTEHVTQGVFKKKTVDVVHKAGCPSTVHLHRRCLTCGGHWFERTAVQEKLT